MLGCFDPPFRGLLVLQPGILRDMCRDVIEILLLGFAGGLALDTHKLDNQLCCGSVQHHAEERLPCQEEDHPVTNGLFICYDQGRSSRHCKRKAHSPTNTAQNHEGVFSRLEPDPDAAEKWVGCKDHHSADQQHQQEERHTVTTVHKSHACRKGGPVRDHPGDREDQRAGDELEHPPEVLQDFGRAKQGPDVPGLMAPQGCLKKKDDPSP